MRMSVDDLLTGSALRWGDKEAVVDAGRSLSYGALEMAASRLANLLRARGCQPGERVALVLPNSASFVIAFFAISRLGAVLVPLSPNYTDRELGVILSDAGVVFALCGQPHVGRLQDLRALLPALLDVLAIDDLDRLETLIAGHSDGRSSGVADWSAPHAILYTSGTTGKPKGAILSHRSRIVNSLSGQIGYEIGTATRANIPAPMFHSGGMILGLINVIAAGGTLLIPPDGGVEAQCHALEELGANLLLTVPTMIYRMVESPVFRSRAGHRAFALIHGASPIPAAVVSKLLDDFPACRPFHGYGSTEACQLTVLGPEEYRAFPAMTGRALPGIDVRVLREDGEVVTPGEVGEIVTTGPHVFDGYLNDAEQTQAALHGGLHWTGDLATIDARGLISVVGRRKDMIISGGFNVYTREVEDIIHTHPAVEEAAVFGLPDVEWGEVVAAAVILRPGMHLNAEGLRRHCRQGLTGYKTPGRIWFVDAMPRTPVGKVRKPDLAKQFMERRQGDL
jgi:acyl-CoA synthetase (AMP-forming)/AMP-acid ligase II